MPVVHLYSQVYGCEMFHYDTVDEAWAAYARLVPRSAQNCLSDQIERTVEYAGERTTITAENAKRVLMEGDAITGAPRHASTDLHRALWDVAVEAHLVCTCWADDDGPDRTLRQRLRQVVDRLYALDPAPFDAIDSPDEEE